MSDTSSADPVSRLLELRASFEALGKSEGLAILFSYRDSVPSKLALAQWSYPPTTRDRFHRLAIQAGKLIVEIPAAEQICPTLAAEPSPAGKWFRLLFELAPDAVYFAGESYPAWKVETPGPREAGRFFWVVQLSLRAIDRLALLAEEGAGTGHTSHQGGAGEGEKELRPSREKAYRLFLWAMEQNPNLKTDREVYDWLNEHPEMSDDLPRFSSWSKYLREARSYHDDHKRTPRTTKDVSGKSVVRRNQI